MEYNFMLTIFIYILYVSNVKLDEEPLVKTPLGKIRGSIITSRLGKQIYSFRGIRYAKAPTEELRFQPPVPVDKWEEVYDATKDGPLCPQPTSNPISEDCLILNVYTTKLPTHKCNPKRPVIVFLHAGGFYSVGSASYWEGPQYFLDQDIVLVTINYRLGSLGFLSTGDQLAPGNNGLKDQVEALKWVKYNIEPFGGDPNSVTLMGYSAGAQSVVLHMVSLMSQGLFHKAAALSHTALSQVPVPRDQIDVARKQARFVGCPDDTAVNIVSCLKTKPFRELGDSLPKFAEFGYDPVLIWLPVIEPESDQPRFLTDHPIRLITSGRFHQVPFITGRTTDEFGYLSLNVLKNKTLTQEINEKFNKVAPIAFLYERNTNFSKSVSRAIRKFYFHDQPIDDSQQKALDEAYEDSIIGFGVNRAAKLMAEYSKKAVYYYRFSYRGRYSHVYLPNTNNTVPYGVTHHDDLIYLFYISTLFPLFKENSPKEVEMVTKLTSLYANFARTGNPTPEGSKILDIKWEPFTISEQKYLDIGNKIEIKNHLNRKRFQFWEKLFPLSLYTDNQN